MYLFERAEFILELAVCLVNILVGEQGGSLN
jgi:hypothetical protein